MNNGIKVVIGTDHVGPAFADELRILFPKEKIVEAYDESKHIDAIQDAHVFFGWPNDKTFAAANQLKWIACPGMGIDKIVAHQNILDSDVPITNAPGTHVTSMADYTIGAMIGLAHRFQEAFEDRKARKWETQKFNSRIIELTGKTVGIFGLGAIGRAVATRALAFGTTIFAVDPSPSEIPAGIQECWGLDQLDDLCRISNFLVITAPILGTTKNSIEAKQLALMPKEAFVVIVSRGGIVDEEALADSIEKGQISGAALDATTVEPLPEDSRLWSLDNIILTPHVSALTPELYEMRRETFRKNLRRFLNNQPLMNICDKSAGF